MAQSVITAAAAANTAATMSADITDAIITHDGHHSGQTVLTTFVRRCQRKIKGEFVHSAVQLYSNTGLRDS